MLKPMLAANAPEDLYALTYPLYASPKLDGLRCLIVAKDWYRETVPFDEKYEPYVDRATQAIALSRTLKPIQNLHIQSQLDLGSLIGLDGELIVGPENAQDAYTKSESGVMSRDGMPDFTFHIFDAHDRGIIPYAAARAKWLSKYLPDTCRLHEQVLISSVVELEDYEVSCLSSGFEGVITRDIASPYKFGRSTVREQYLLKVKRFMDFEAVIVGFEERMHNANEAKQDERGYTKRSSHQENKIPTGMLGAFICEKDGTRFNVGTGFTDAQRKTYWELREILVGKLAKVKSFPIGVKEAPRHPVFMGLRSEEDR